MTDNSVRDEIAFIRRAIEKGRGYAVARSPEFVIWGLAVAVGYLGNYAVIRGWLRADPGWLWAVCLLAPWVYTLQRPLRHWLFQSGDWPDIPPMGRALRMVWIGCAIFLTALAVPATIAGDMRWFAAVAAGTIGIGFFASAFLCNLPWMRWVAAAWWIAEIAAFALRNRTEVLVLMAILMVLLFVLPGVVLMRTRPMSVHA